MDDYCSSVEYMVNTRYKNALEDTLRVFGKESTTLSRIILLDEITEILGKQNARGKLREVLEKVLLVFGGQSTQKAKNILLRVIRSALKECC